MRSARFHLPIVAPVGMLAVAIAMTAAAPSEARPRKPTTASNFVQRLDRLVLGRQAHRHVKLSRADRQKLRALPKRFVGKKQRANAKRQFGQLARGRGGRGQARQLDALVGSVAYAAQSEQIPQLGKLVDGLAAKAAQAEVVRTKLKCKEDNLKSPTGGLARSRVWCTPTVPASAVVGFHELLKTAKEITIQVQRMEATVNRPGPTRQLALADLADVAADDLLAEFMKLNASDPGKDPKTLEKLALLTKLLKLQAQYDAAKKKCDQGNDAECTKAKALAAEIAEIEAQLAAS